MGIKAHYTNQGYYAEIGAYLRGGSPNYSPVHPLSSYDPIAQSLTDTVLSYGLQPIEAAIGHYREGEETCVEILRTKPNTTRYRADWDYQRYGGSILSSIVTIARLYNGSRGAFVEVPHREKDTIHHTCRGEVGPVVAVDDRFIDSPVSGGDVPVIWGISTLSGPGFRVFDSSFISRVQHAQYSWGTDYSHVPDSPPSWAPRRRTIDTLEDIRTGRYWGVGSEVFRQFPWTPAGQGGFVQLTSFSYTYEEGVSIVVDYGIQIRSNCIGNDGGPEIGTVRWDCSFSHWLVSKREPTSWPERDYDIDDVTTALNTYERWTSKCTYASNPDRALLWFGSALGTVGSTVTTEAPNRGPCVLLSEVGTASLESIGRYAAALPKISQEKFCSEVDKYTGDIRASAFLSCSDAMESLENSLEENLLESLSQLRGLTDYLPSIKEALDVVRRLSAKDALGSIVEILDLITELRLRYAFSYAPDFDLLTEKLPLIGGLLESLQPSGSKHVVARGVFKWDFPTGEFGRPHTTLETRTKIVAVRDTSSVLSKILGLDGLGLTPVPSNLWDLVPFSFALDWVLNIGDRIRDSETALFAAALGPTYLVHSFRVVTKLDEEELRQLGLMPWKGTESNVEWIWYKREVSREIPPPRDGRYDFRMPVRLPNWMTAGSLGWQLFS